MRADEAVARAARTGSADAHHPTRFAFRRLFGPAAEALFRRRSPGFWKVPPGEEAGQTQADVLLHTCGVNEQFEASDVRDSNPSALFRAGAGSNATIAVARLTPRPAPTPSRFKCGCARARGASRAEQVRGARFVRRGDALRRGHRDSRRRTEERVRVEAVLGAVERLARGDADDGSVGGDLAVARAADGPPENAFRV